MAVERGFNDMTERNPASLLIVHSRIVSDTL